MFVKADCIPVATGKFALPHLTEPPTCLCFGTKHKMNVVEIKVPHRCRKQSAPCVSLHSLCGLTLYVVFVL